MLANGHVTGRVKLGISGHEIDESEARNYGLKEGIYIYEIEADSDLNNTTAQRFDIITHVDGERVTSFVGLQKALGRYSPGDRVTLTIFRSAAPAGSQTFEVEIALQEDVG
jgi:serine protease Do